MERVKVRVYFFSEPFKVFGRINMEDVPLKNEWQCYGKISYINI